MGGDVDDQMAEQRTDMLFMLQRVRDAIIRTAEGLSEDQQRAPGVPSGTNLLGLIQHLTAMEVHWLDKIFLGHEVEVDSSMTVPAAQHPDEVITAYREACRQSDHIIAGCRDLTKRSEMPARMPASTSRDADPGEPARVSLRRIVLHLTQETARHAGHADILREQIDGETDL